MSTIVDSKGDVSFFWDPSRQVYEFRDPSLEKEINHGIPIPPYLQKSFGGKQLIYPSKLEKNDYDLFIKAFTDHFYKTELVKDGYKIVEKPTPNFIKG